MREKKKKRIICIKCANYYVTWDKSFPNGCKAYGFKTKHMPSQEVLMTSGIECQLFKPRRIPIRVALRDKAAGKKP